MSISERKIDEKIFLHALPILLVEKKKERVKKNQEKKI